MTLALVGAIVAIGGVAAATGTGKTPTPSTVVLPDRSIWSYYRGAAPPEASWRTDLRGWPSAQAPFGFGLDTGPVETVLSKRPGSDPLATYFRTSFDLPAVDVEGAVVTTWADDGVIIYVNGLEIGRANVPSDAPVTHQTSADAAPSSMAARRAALTFTVPAASLRAGANVVAAQVAANGPDTPNISFDARLSVTSKDALTLPIAHHSDTDLLGWGAPDWQDEFTYHDPSSGSPAVDPKNWNVRNHVDLGLLPDASVVRPEQVSVDSSGILHIRATWLSSPVNRPRGDPGPRKLWHATGYLDQRSIKAGDMSKKQRYGRWEIRTKVPTGPRTFGALAAFWLRNEQSGEIDIMEAWGFNKKALRDQRIGSATTTIHTHTGTPEDNRKYSWHHSDYGGPVPVWEDFHTYAFEFTPTYAALYVDGIQLKRVTPKSHPNLWDTRYFGSPLHVRMNLHVGASPLFWGIPDPNHRETTQDLDYQIDYVRIWSLD